MRALRNVRKNFWISHAAVLLLIAVGVCGWNPVARAGGRAAAVCPGDMLKIKVYQHPDLTSEVRVQKDGRIRLPLCGWVDAGGKTVAALSEALSSAYTEADIENAFVTVQITAYGPRTVYVIGEVLQGGTSMEITPPASLTVTQAVSAAGGFTDNADLRHVTVRRTDRDGKVNEIDVDVLALISGEKGAADPVLEVGDTVIIPRSKPVYVTGEVNAPGTYYVGTNSSLRCSEILGKAEGLADTADRTRILIFRRNQDADRDDKRLLEVNMAEVFAGKFVEDAHIRPGDMVVVSRRRKIYVFGEVDDPGDLELEPGISLTAFQAVTLSGGFTEYASEGDVLLARNGKMKTLDLRRPYKKGESVSDPKLRPGDILFVQSSIW